MRVDRLWSRKRLLRAGVALLSCAGSGIAACETLPHDGPSTRGIEEAAPAGNYALVDLDYRVSQLVAANPPRRLTTLAPASSNAANDLIGVGDVLSVWVYQAGGGPVTARANADDQSSAQTVVPTLTVDRGGEVSVPFAGPVRVSGLTVRQASDAIRAALVGKVMNPQVVVSLASNVSNSVTVIGEVRNAGRVPISASSDRLMDVLALSGGLTRSPADLDITVVRGDRSASTDMSAVMADPAENIRLAPRDQVRLSYKPRRFSTFGAVGRSAQLPIETETLTLAGALGQMGGLNPAAADATSVMVFRFERPEVVQALGVQAQAAPAGAPVIYRLNLRDPSGYFIASTFEVRPDDLIYAPRSDSTELRSFFDLVQSITRVAYDLTVSEVLR